MFLSFCAVFGTAEQWGTASCRPALPRERSIMVLGALMVEKWAVELYFWASFKSG